MTRSYQRRSAASEEGGMGSITPLRRAENRRPRGRSLSREPLLSSPCYRAPDAMAAASEPDVGGIRVERLALSDGAALPEFMRAVGVGFLPPENVAQFST